MHVEQIELQADGPAYTNETDVLYLWEFLLELLQDKDCCSWIGWTDTARREFCLKDPDEIAKLWGILKQRPSMNKKKLCRAIRYYYNSKLVTKVHIIMLCLE